MQPIACIELLLPKSEPNAPEFISEDFEQLTKKIQSTDEYGFGPQANITALLKGEWAKVFLEATISYPTNEFIYTYFLKNFTSYQHEPDSKIKGSQPTKKHKNSAQMTKTVICSLAHPALGMYSSK